jgi:hypothetical protein
MFPAMISFLFFVIAYRVYNNNHLDIHHQLSAPHESQLKSHGDVPGGMIHTRLKEKLF